jgi:hypothetical protein
MKTKYLILILPLLILAACKPEIDEFDPSAGNADFTRYIAVGDFWTSGFADGSLYISGQEYSFPNLLAGQFTTVGGGAFPQPLMVDDIGFGMPVPNVFVPKLVLGYKQDCLGVTSLAPGYAQVPVNQANFASIASGNPYYNIGMPGLKSIYMGVAGFATLNPYYGRFAPNPMTPVIELIPPVDATFFSLWLGNFDIQYYAMQGGTGDQITPTEQFTQAMGATLQVLTANGAKGAIANIPDMTDAPYFRTIPYNAIPIPDQQTADMLNYAYAPLNMAIKLAGSNDTIHFAPGPNPMVIIDASLPWLLRQTKPTDLVLLSLPTDSLKCAGWGTQKPIDGKYILDATETANVQYAVLIYRDVIAQLAESNGLALVDMYSLMKNLYMDGLAFDGVQFDGRMVQGNFYSLDGLNPTPAGSAIVANHFIEAINAKFEANLPKVIVSDYPTVVFP